MDKKDNSNPLKKKTVKLPQTNQLDTVSPATRLLEKRRLMYEKQEEYESKKKENEALFRDQEKDLREKDLNIQETMIKFSIFLQENERKKKRADEKIKQEDKLIEEKTQELYKKQEELKILEQKAKRIDFKVKAMTKYEDYLNKVKDDKPDEFSEIQDITSRYQTLMTANERLTKNLQDLDAQQVLLKNTVTKYEKDMRTDIMSLNVDITNLKQQHEAIEDDKNQLRNEATETSSKKLNKISDLAKILMAIDSMENRCLNRNESSKLKYKLESLTNLTKPQFFNLFQKRTVYAQAQLNFIEQYLHDFREIVKNVKVKNSFIKGEIDKRVQNGEII